MAPAISPVYPLDGQTIPWHKPTISIAVNGADIEPGSIELKLDNEPVDSVYDPIAASVTYTPGDYLATGAHALYIRVENPQGEISELSLSFAIRTNITGALHSDGKIELSGDAYIAGDTYSSSDTAISGSPTVAGNGYAGGVIAWDGFSRPFLGMPYSNQPLRDFPIIDFNYYKSLVAEALGGSANRYIYDGLDQLASWLDPNGTVDYVYDGAGNLTEKGDTTFTYNEANQLVSDGADTYAYDDRGNLTSDGANTYAWDAAGRLLSFTSTVGSTTYTYDYKGRRLE